MRKIKEGKITLEEIRKEDYDFDVILQMFNFWTEVESILADPEQQEYILTNIGCYNAKLYKKLIPHIKPEVWAKTDIAYMVLSRCVSEFRNPSEYAAAFKKYVNFFDSAEVGKLALHKLYAGKAEERDNAYFVIYMILDSLSTKEP